MKKLSKYILCLLLATVFFPGCDDGFDELNIPKTAFFSVDPVFLLNSSVNGTSLTGNAVQGYLAVDFGIVQQILSTYGSSVVGANYNQLGNNTHIWATYYSAVVKPIIDVIAKTEADKSNLYYAALIWKSHAIMVLTDHYGDIPYFDAGKGYLEGIVKPRFDRQQDIYDDILKTLDEAAAALDPAKTMPTNDILLGGNITRWKRFGYSLMLRAAMRLSKSDPAKAQVYVTKAINGGLTQSNADNVILRHTQQFMNQVGFRLNGGETHNWYIAKPFIDFLKITNDPRLPIFSMRFVGATSSAQQTASRVSTDPALQIGIPVGHDNVTIVNTFAENGVVSLWDYSQPNKNTVVSVLAPEFILSHAQTLFLLAEAITRGWTSGDAGTVYANAIRSALEQMTSYGVTIPEATIMDYITSQALVPANALEQINNQYWVNSYLNGHEVFANFRRSGYPALAPNPYPQSEIPGGFIRRMPYPDSEYVVNLDNVKEANERQGPDIMATRVWWDKE